MMTVRTLLIFCAFFSGLPALAQVTEAFCGSLAASYGPFEYRADKFVQSDNESYRTKLGMVEGAHFTPNIQNLIVAKSGRNANNPIGDELNYVLTVFPNHHRALLVLKRLGEKTKSARPKGLRYDLECYFERALRFRPDDAIVRIIYSTYLTSHKRDPEAIAQLEQATRTAGESAFTHYNIGLAYFEMKIYDKALVQAHKALALGFERVQLRAMLEKEGQWREPIAAPTEAPVAPPANTPTLAPKPEQ